VYEFVQFIVPLLTAVIAIILLVAGGRLLKPAVGLGFGLLGAGCGLLIAQSLSMSISPLIIALFCGIISAIIAVFVAKFAILLTLGISLAVAAPVVTWHVVGLGDGTKVVEDFIEAATAEDHSQPTPVTSNGATLGAAEDAVTAAFSMVAGDMARAVQSGVQRANAAWDVIPTAPRLMLVGSAIAGLLIGLLIATFMPFHASVIVTSASGSILLVEAIRNFIALAWSQSSLSTVSPTVLMFTTAGIALAGLGLQLTLLRRGGSKKKPAK
jgi:hypothetical protein